MLPIFTLLAEEHRQLNQLLNLLEHRVNEYLEDFSARPRARLMRDALDYIQQYPELFHHPLEERLMRLLEPKVQDPELLAVMSQISAEHQLLEQMSVELVEYFDAICRGQLLPVRSLIRGFTRYARLQRSHIQLEEERLLPALEPLLSIDEEAELMHWHKPIDDPLFINPSRSGFADLYRALQSSSIS